MTDKQIKVGDVVAWEDVPSGALARRGPAEVQSQKRLAPIYTGWFTKTRPIRFSVDLVVWGNAAACDCDPCASDLVTIIALDVPDDATADDLRTLVERFEVRCELPLAELHAWGRDREYAVFFGTRRIAGHWDGEHARTLAAERLHAAGWRPGMTAEDAARLLAEAG